MNASKYNLVDPQGLEYNAVVNDTSASSTSTLSREAIVGYARFGVNDKYFFTGDIRRDGSSIFADTKWGTFGSFSAAWLMSSEDFFTLDMFDFFKLKASYGVLGKLLAKELIQVMMSILFKT